MSAISETPTNKNLLPNNGFQFFIKRAPHVNFWVQRAPIPGIELGVVETPNPFINIPVPGEHMSFEELEIVFQVDEDIKNYLEVYNWIKSLGKPDNFDQFAEIKKNKNLGEGIYSDLSLLITDSKRNLNIEVVFKDAFPTALSRLEFDVTSQDVEYLKASARFIYTSHEINAI